MKLDDVLPFASAAPIEEVALYIHVPFCKQRCAYCDFFSTTGEGSLKFLTPSAPDGPSPYAKKILADLNGFREIFSIKHFSSIYIGGGTPSLLSKNDIEFFAKTIFDKALRSAEITIELNPESLKADFLRACLQAGVNRFSLGVQTIGETTLKSQNRITSTRDIFNALDLLASLQRESQQTTNLQTARPLSISCDVIVGFEGQTEAEVVSTLESLFAREVAHISVYTLCSDDYRQDIENDKSSQLFDVAKARLAESGYRRYEVSNFALAPTAESVHNKAYWKMQNYLGLGPSGVGTIGLPVERTNQYKNKDKRPVALRFTGKKNLTDFFTQDLPYNIEKITFIESLKEYLLMGFRLLEGIEKNAFFERFGLSLDDICQTTMTKYRDFLSLNNDKKIAFSDTGIDFLSAILTDAFLEIDKGTSINFSF